jgi:hypothetical protein
MNSSDQDMEERLLTWEDINPGNCETMLKNRGKRIRRKVEELLGFSEEGINVLFGKREESWKIEQPAAADG